MYISGAAADPCEQCGMCCTLYRGTKWAQNSDLLRWHDEGRPDILIHVAATSKCGELVNCTLMTRDRLSELICGDGWADPDTRKSIDKCPFLLQADEKRWICSIHKTKPDICRSYNPGEWKNFNYVEIPCPVLLRERGRLPDL
jgi:Fe-S-cluster containining protein